MRQTSSTHGPDDYFNANSDVIEYNLQRLSDKLLRSIDNFIFYYMDQSVDGDTLIFTTDIVDITETAGRINSIPDRAHKIPSTQTALVSLALIADQTDLLSTDLLMNGLRMRFKVDQLTDAPELIERCASVKIVA